MSTDPRLVVRRLFDPQLHHSTYAVTQGNLLWEDGVTYAKHESTYEEPPNMLRDLMFLPNHIIDLFFMILLLGEEPPDEYGSGPVCYNYVIGVQSVTINKLNSDGSVKINGVKLARAAKEEIRKVIRENPFSSLRNIRGTTRNTTMVSTQLIWGDIMEVIYKQYTPDY